MSPVLKSTIFNSYGELIAQVLNAGDLAFSSNGKLFVSGANFTTGDAEYIAEVDVDTGQIVRKFDPADGDPNDGDFKFYEISLHTIAARWERSTCSASSTRIRP